MVGVVLAEHKAARPIGRVPGRDAQAGPVRHGAGDPLRHADAVVETDGVERLALYQGTRHRGRLK